MSTLPTVKAAGTPRSVDCVAAEILDAPRTTPRVWGLPPAERARRALRRLEVPVVADATEACPADGSAVIVRGDIVFDGGALEALVESLDVLVTETGAPDAPGLAAHVSSDRIAAAKAWLERGGPPPHGARAIAAEALRRGYRRELRKREEPFVAVVTADTVEAVERRLFRGAYKGVTDLVTKYLWPLPAMHVTRLCVRLGLTPNMVTSASAVLMLVALWLFWRGDYGWGLLSGCAMTFLDTVDGKLARVTLTATRFGNLFDHGMDIVHPPFWYAAWGLGLASSAVALPPGWLEPSLWAMLAGYIGGRLAEGYFVRRFGFEIFVWRRFDSLSRLVTARRNPNMILLGAGWLAGRPDIGLLAVVFWTLVSTAVLATRAVAAEIDAALGRPVQSWLEAAR